MAENSQITGASARRVYARDFINHFDRVYVFPRYASRSMEAEMLRANTAVWSTDTTSYAVSTRSSLNWPTGINFTVGSVTMNWDQDYAESIIIAMTTQSEIGPDAVAQAAARVANSFAKQLDDNCVTELNGLNAANLWAVPIYPSNSTTVTQQIVAGGTNNYLDKNGVWKGSSKDKSTFYDALWTLFRNLLTNDRLGNGQRYTLIMPPLLWLDLQTVVEGKQADILKVNFINGRWQRTLWDVFDIVLSTALTHGQVAGTGTSGSKNGLDNGKDYTPCYCIASQGIQTGLRHRVMQVLSPGENQSGPHWRVNHAISTYYNVVDPRYVWRVSVRAEA